MQDSRLAIAPYTPELLTQAQEYVKAMGLPQAATVSACLSVAAHEALEKRMREELALGVDEQFKLLTSSEKRPPNGQEWSQILAYSRDRGFPLSSLYVFHQQQKLIIGVLAEGLKLRLQADPRILMSVVSEEAGLWTMGPRLLLRMAVKVEFWNRETYVGRAGASSDAPQVTKGGGLDVLVGLAETRARSRAARMALRLPFAQDDESPMRDEEPSQSVYAIAWERWHLNYAAVNQLLGLATDDDAAIVLGGDAEALSRLEEAKL